MGPCDERDHAGDDGGGGYANGDPLVQTKGAPDGEQLLGEAFHRVSKKTNQTCMRISSW
jgi:hypothetical protein